MTLIKSCEIHKTMYYRECRECKHMKAKAEHQAKKDANKLAIKLLKANEKAKQPRAKVSKNPKDWTNTFLCSDGTRVTQAEINEKRSQAYKEKYGSTVRWCEGCKKWLVKEHAHIIPQARCKAIGKTELIWHFDNFFRADNQCNAAIENPKGKAWKALLNIDHCLKFIKEHDPGLFAKFEQSAIDQTKPTI